MLSPILNAYRSWKSAKAVALLAIAALAVGIGSATAIYTVVEAVLLRPLSYQHGERFGALLGGEIGNADRYSSVSLADLQDYARNSNSFDLFGVFQPVEFSLTSPGQPQHLKGVEVTPELASNLGVSPVIGRWFGTTAGEQGKVNLAVIAEGLWKRLGGQKTIIGQTIVMNGKPYTVTGVMPPWFRFPVAFVDGGEFRADVWVPLDPHGRNLERDVYSYFSYVRLKPGVSFAHADADVKRVLKQVVAKQHPNLPASYTAVVMNLKELVIKEIRPTLLLLFGAAGALLLITCANVAGLLLSRSVARARETAIRTALGASLRQLAIQYFAEGLIVAVAGAAGGVLVALGLLRFLLSVAIDSIPRADSIGLDWVAMLFAFGAAVASTVLFSLAPLWQAARTQPRDALSDGVRSSAGAGSRGLSRSLVVAEIALAFTLLSVSTMLLGHLNRLLGTSAGFDANQLITFSLTTTERAYAPRKMLLDAVERVPGVTAAAFANQIPVEGCCIETVIIPEGMPRNPSENYYTSLMLITPGYFHTMRIPLLKGRLPQPGPDEKEESLGVVIDEAAVKRFFPGRDPVGSFVHVGGPTGTPAHILGVVGSVRDEGLAKEPRAEVFVMASMVPIDPIRFIVRSPLSVASLVPAIRSAILRVNPAQPIYDVQTMREVFLGSIVRERLQSFLTLFFAASALLMAGLGVYGVVSYSVRQRTVEIGTRMALGAVSRDVFRLVVGDGLVMALWGVLLGGVAVAGAALVLRSEVFGVHLDSPLPFLYSTAILAAFSALACLFPAWRAALVSPMVAIRDDQGSIWRSISTRVSGILANSVQDEPIAEGAIMAEFVDASRQAESFQQAMRGALGTLSQALNVRSAQLLGREATGPYLCVAKSPAEGSVCSVSAGGLLIGRLRHYGRPLPLSSSDLDTWARATVGHEDEIASIRESGTALAVPLLSRNGITGILLLGAHEDGGAFTSPEKNLLRNCAAQFALMLENARLTDRMVEQEKLRRDVQLAVEVQKRLFPDKPPVSGAVTLAGMSIPARSVGGDYYDFLSLPDHKIGIALADVAGKGIAAALVMSVVQASLRVLATEPNVTLAELAAKMNRYLHRSTGTNSYATFFYGQIDEEKRQLRYVNAGHNPPYLLRYVAGQVIEELPAGGTVIGLFPQMSYQEATLDLNPGDVLIAFTDGVPEALNPEEEEFGEDRVRAILSEFGHLSVDDLAAQIAGRLKDWIADAAQYDDLTFILMKVNE